VYYILDYPVYYILGHMITVKDNTHVFDIIYVSYGPAVIGKTNTYSLSTFLICK